MEKARKNIFVHHSPNGGRRSRSEGGRFKAQGVRAGFPDLLILKRGGSAFFIELKVIPNDVDEIQVDVQAYIDDLGFNVYNIRAQSLYDGLQQLNTILLKEGI